MPNKILFKKQVDASLLQKGGLTVSAESQLEIYKHCGKSLSRGETMTIKIEIEGEIFDASLYNINNSYKSRPKDAVQIRYSGGSPLAQKMQSLFPEQNRCVTDGDQIPDDLIDYVYFTLTDTPGQFAFVLQKNKMTREELIEAFRKYLQRLKLNVATSYPNNVEFDYVKETAKDLFGVDSVYDLEDADHILQVAQALKNHPKDKTRHGQGSCAVKKYATFYATLRLKKTSLLTADEMSLIADNLKYLLAAKAKPFLILGGFSGTGKSQKVKELAYLTCPQIDDFQSGNEPGNYCLISVKPNWHDSTELLGYYSSISQKYMCTDFMRFLVKAMNTPEVPFFVCLDEMNLAPVEEYLAEYLSVLESRKLVDGSIISAPLVSATVFNATYKENIFESLGLNTEDEESKNTIELLKLNGLTLPQNVIVIGTVNMDDTTNSFSRKVIDRAITFETEIETFSVDSYFDKTESLEYKNLDCNRFVCDQVKASDALFAEPDLLTDEEKETIIKFINDINDRMAGSPFQVSYRVLNEIILYYRSMKKLVPAEASLDKVFSTILMTKVLPRIEGDSDRVKAPLEGLRDFVESGADKNLWKPVADKINYMLKPFENSIDGFTRFWI